MPWRMIMSESRRLKKTIVIANGVQNQIMQDGVYKK